MKIYLVRHGQTDYNVNDLLQGWTDNELNENGINQAFELSQKLKNEKFDIIFSSDLKRAIQTAQIINENNKFKTNLISDKRLREQYMGDWEGKKYSMLVQEYKEFFIKVKENPFYFNPPNGEKFEDVVNRVKSFLNELEKQNYEKILIVGHQIVNAIIFTILENKNWNDFWNYKQKNSEIWILNFIVNRTITNTRFS
ncbi:MAG: histidine phosphatase family protein [candidate division WOR-3 bacterium]